MSIIVHDSTGLISGAPKVIIDGSGAWTDKRSIDFDQIRRYVAAKPAKSSLVFDLEEPSLLTFDAFRSGVTPDKFKRDVATAVKVLEVAKAERPDMLFAWYDAIIDAEPRTMDALEAKYRHFTSRDDGNDAWWRGTLITHLGELAKVEWANDLLRDVHRASGFVCHRCYFSLKWVKNAAGRAAIIDWVWRQAVLAANGEKPAMLLYKPNCQNGGGNPTYHDDAGIAADVSAFHRSGVTRVCLWRDQFGPADRIVMTAKLARKRVSKVDSK